MRARAGAAIESLAASQVGNIATATSKVISRWFGGGAAEEVEEEEAAAPAATREQQQIQQAARITGVPATPPRPSEI